MRYRSKDPLGPARRMAEFMGGVIAAATALSHGEWKHSAISCRRKPEHRKCPGRLLVCKKPDDYIEWVCPSCGDAGTIHHWQGSPWNMSEVSNQCDHPAFEVVVTEQEYDVVKKCLIAYPLHDRIIYGAAYTAEGIILRAAGGELDDLAEDLALTADSTKNTRIRRILEEVLDRVQVVLGEWSPD